MCGILQDVQSAYYGADTIIIGLHGLSTLTETVTYAVRNVVMCMYAICAVSTDIQEWQYAVGY